MIAPADCFFMTLRRSGFFIVEHRQSAHWRGSTPRPCVHGLKHATRQLRAADRAFSKPLMPHNGDTDVDT